MSHPLLRLIAGSVTAILGIIALLIWFSTDPTKDFTTNVPGMDNKSAVQASTPEKEVKIGEFFEQYDSAPPENMPGEWISFRGSEGDNISKEKTSLADSWGPEGPKILWTVELGEGHAAPAIHKGKVYLLDYMEKERCDALRCYSLKTGKELWRRWYKVKVKRNHGMSRTVPAVTDKYIVTVGPRCHTMCVRTDTGEMIWGIDMEKRYGTKTPFWYTGQCPIIDDGIAVLAPAGSKLLVGVDCETGEVVWETPNPDKWNMSHVSVVQVKLFGKKMYIYSAIEGMVAVSAEKEDRGTLLWKTTLWTHSVLAPSPVVMPDGKIFLTAGYGAGSMVLQVSKEAEGYKVEKRQEFLPKEGLASEQQTPIYYKGHLFGIEPKDAGTLRNQFVCFKPKDCTKPVWTSNTIARFGLGPYIVADDKIYILNDDGNLTMIEASTKKFNVLGKARILKGHDAWGPLAIAGGLMVLRDSKTMACIDLRR